MAPAAILVALLTLPFHPFWMDMELVRRAWLLCLVGALCLLRPGALLGPLRRADLWFVAWLCWSALGALFAANGWEAIYRLAWLTALFALFRWGRHQDSAIWLRAILPTAIAVATYGLLQRLGLPWPTHYALPTAPVSTLGNLNVSSELTAIGTVAALMRLGRGERAWPATTLLLTTAYLIVNGSRSGMLAALVALVWLMFTARGSNWKILAVSLCLLGAGLGTALPGPAGEQLEDSPLSRTSTIEVRLEIWKGCADMAAEAPFLGHGPGQFPIQYPRFRREREIELSTAARQFQSSPHTAHNDPLEILVEGGVPGLLFACGFLITASLAVYRQGMLAQLTPLLCFVALGLVRSPLGNAPVAAWLMVYLGALLPDARPRSPQRALPWCTRTLGLFLVVAGIPVIVAQTLAAPYLAAKPDLRQPDRVHLERAVSWTPFDPSLRELLVQEHINPVPPELAAANHHLEALAALAPHSPFRLLLVVKAALLSSDLDRAQEALDQLLDLDPGEVEASMLRSTVHFLRGDHEAAIEDVYSNPHDRVREQLPAHMARLENSATQRGDQQTARIYSCERAFLSALTSLRQMAAAQSAVQEAVKGFRETDRLHRDIRPWLLLAIQFRGLDDEAEVEAMAAEAEKRGLQLTDSHRRLFGDLLDRLQGSPGWQPTLDG